MFDILIFFRKIANNHEQDPFYDPKPDLLELYDFMKDVNLEHVYKDESVAIDQPLDLTLDWWFLVF